MVRAFEAGYRHILPWFLPGTIVAAVLGLLVARVVARFFRTNFWVAWGIATGFGMIIAATLTPLRGELNLAAVGGTCDLSRIGLAPLGALSHIDDTSLNIALFIPFGVAIGLIRGSRRKVLLIIAAGVLPVVIETVQLLVPALERGCQSADVFDNLSGLVIGLAIGTAAARLSGGIPSPGMDDAPRAT